MYLWFHSKLKSLLQVNETNVFIKTGSYQPCSIWHHKLSRAGNEAVPKSKYFTIPLSLDLSVGVDSHCDDHESTPQKNKQFSLPTLYWNMESGIWSSSFFPREILALLFCGRTGQSVGELSRWAKPPPSYPVLPTGSLSSMVSPCSCFQWSTRAQGSPQVGWKSYVRKAIPQFLLETCTMPAETAGNQAVTVKESSTRPYSSAETEWKTISSTMPIATSLYWVRALDMNPSVLLNRKMHFITFCLILHLLWLSCPISMFTPQSVFQI